MSTGPRVIDVSSLPTTVFGRRGLGWWGTLGFMVVEGTTLAVALWAYFYLRRNFPEWPPAATPVPDALPGTIGTLLLLLQIPAMRLAAQSAHRFDPSGVRRWLAIVAAAGALVIVLRALELDAVQVRWDDDAYGSLLWILLGLHGTLVLVDVLETLALFAVMGSHEREPSHFADVDDAALYQYFLSLAWLPIYTVVYLVTRL